MATINSVLGAVDTSDLGFTLSHEYVLQCSAGIQHTYPEFIDREGTIKRAVALFEQVYAEGVRSIIDVTTIDLGWDVGALVQVQGGAPMAFARHVFSGRSMMNVVPCPSLLSTPMLPPCACIS